MPLTGHNPPPKQPPYYHNQHLHLPVLDVLQPHLRHRHVPEMLYAGAPTPQQHAVLQKKPGQSFWPQEG